MWERACEVTKHSVHAVLRKVQVKGRDVWFTVGTAFLIGREPPPTLLTNAHVVADKELSIHPDLALAVFLQPEAAVAGLRVRQLVPELDLAVLDGGMEASRGTPVVFGEKEPMPPGRAVAALGFPIPAKPVLHDKGGNLRASRRLATGYVSGPEITVRFENAPWTLEGLFHYETYMLSYPGASGGPLLNVDGKVVGVNRGSLPHNQQVAAYSFALRNKEVLTYLDEHGIPYLRND